MSFCSFCRSLAHLKPINMGLQSKKEICYLKEKTFNFKSSRPLGRESTSSTSELFPLELYPFPLTNCKQYIVGKDEIGHTMKRNRYTW